MSCTNVCGQQRPSTKHRLMKLMGFSAPSLCLLWSASLRLCQVTGVSLAGAAARKWVPCKEQYLIRPHHVYQTSACHLPVSQLSSVQHLGPLLLPLLLLQEAEHAAAIAGVELLTAEKVLRPDVPAGSHSRGTASASPSVSSATSGISLPGVGAKRSKSNADPLDEDPAGESSCSHHTMSEQQTAACWQRPQATR